MLPKWYNSRLTRTDSKNTSKLNMLVLFIYIRNFGHSSRVQIFKPFYSFLLFPKPLLFAFRFVYEEKRRQTESWDREWWRIVFQQHILKGKRNFNDRSIFYGSDWCLNEAQWGRVHCMKVGSEKKTYWIDGNKETNEGVIESERDIFSDYIASNTW